MRERAVLVIAILLLGFPVRSFSQVPEEQNTIEVQVEQAPAPSISPEELQRAVDDAVSETQRRAEARAEALRKRVEESQKKLEGSIVEAVRGSEQRTNATITASEKERLEREAEVVATNKKILTWIGVFAAVLLAVAIVVSLFAIKKASRNKMDVITTPNPEEKTLTDPEIKDLDEFFEKHGIEKFKTILTLRGERKFICWAHRVKKDGGRQWMATIGKDDEKVSWKNRKQRAEMLENEMLQSEFVA